MYICVWTLHNQKEALFVDRVRADVEEALSSSLLLSDFLLKIPYKFRSSHAYHKFSEIARRQHPERLKTCRDLVNRICRLSSETGSVRFFGLFWPALLTPSLKNFNCTNMILFLPYPLFYLFCINCSSRIQRISERIQAKHPWRKFSNSIFSTKRV